MTKCDQCIAREFSSLKFLDKNNLLKLADCKTSHIIKKGNTIFEEGKIIKGMYCIEEGICKLTKLGLNGKPHLVKLAVKGDLLGQRSLISSKRTNLSAIALTDMKVCFLPKEEINSFFNENNNFSIDVIKNVCLDLKQADDKIVDFGQKTVKERLAKLLIYLYDKFGNKPDNSLDIYLSRDEIANMIGVALETAMRTLSDFKKLGLIDLNGKKIYLLNINKLRVISK